MGKSSIKAGQGTAEADAPAPSTAMVPAAGAPPVPYSGDRVDHDSSSRDLIIPKLGLVNATGPLAKKFRSEYGKYVFEERLVLGGEITVIALALSKYFVECVRGGVQLKFDDEKRIFKTAAQAAAEGYAADWDSKHTHKVEEAATITLMVAGPADDPAGAFFIPAAGKLFAPAVFSVRRGGYRDVYRQLATRQDRVKKFGGALWDTLWTMSAKTDCTSSTTDNEWAEPRITPSGKLTPEDVKTIADAAAGLAS